MPTSHYRPSCRGRRTEFEAPPRCRLSYQHLGDQPAHENIVVSHQPSDDQSHVHVEVAIKDAFAAARRKIESLAQRANGS